MKCPIDGADMRTAAQDGIEIDFCPQCRGVWLNRGELEQIIDRAIEEVAGYGPGGYGGPEGYGGGRGGYEGYGPMDRGYPGGGGPGDLSPKGPWRDDGPQGGPWREDGPQGGPWRQNNPQGGPWRDQGAGGPGPYSGRDPYGAPPEGERPRRSIFDIFNF